MVFTTPSVPSSGSGDVTAPSQCSEPLRSKDGGPSKVSPDIMERCDSYRGAYGISLRYQDRGSGYQQVEQGWF